ncbi:hypothetical protein ACS0TY_023919 [Phlomoides rotata]
MLFCLAEEALGRWIDWEVTSERLTQIPRAPRYLLYVDDILIFAKATIQSIHRLYHILAAYESLSGQLYNPSKFKVYFGSAVTRRIKHTMLRATRIMQGTLTFTYLGVPIFHGAPRFGHLAALADSIICKFSPIEEGAHHLIGVIVGELCGHLVELKMLLAEMDELGYQFEWPSEIG